MNGSNPFSRDASSAMDRLSMFSRRNFAAASLNVSLGPDPVNLGLSDFLDPVD